MTSFYAFCRIVDDIVDEQASGREGSQLEINNWRNEIHACKQNSAQTELGQELQDIIKTYNIPTQYFFDILDGVEMDLNHQRYTTFAELERYCYRVASAVGLVSIRIFGCTNPQTEQYAIALGMAFQLTNILRDVREDLTKYGRIYLPQDEMAAYGVTETNLLESSPNTVCKKLFHMHAFRADHYFNKAQRLITQEDHPHLSAAFVMTEVYRGILEKIRKSNYETFGNRIRLNKLEKIAAITRALWKSRTSHGTPQTPKHVSIFGAGFAGITAAIELTRQGHKVDLYEAKAYFGGRAHSFQEAKTKQTIDNGQHIFMGCYHSCLRLFDMLGVREKLHSPKTLELAFNSPAHGFTHLTASRLPYPFHLIQGLVGFKELSLVDKLSIGISGIPLRLSIRPSPDSTAKQWLATWLQTKGAIRALWEPLCIAALNEPISTADAGLFYEVVRRALIGPAKDSVIYTSKVGLSDLLMPEVSHFLKACGGSIHSNSTLKSFTFEKDRVTSATFSNDQAIQSDIFISALPWNALAALLPAGHPLQAQCSQIHGAPIISIHIWIDKPLIKDPIVGLLDSPLHWIFDRTAHIQPPPSPGVCVYALVISGAYDFVKTNSKEITELALRELRIHFPDQSDFKLLHSVAYKSLDATFATIPEINKHRPDTQTPWKNLLLAGDWTNTRLPATLEGAAWSGFKAAEMLNKKP